MAGAQQDPGAVPERLRGANLKSRRARAVNATRRASRTTEAALLLRALRVARPRSLEGGGGLRPRGMFPTAAAAAARVRV